MKKVLIAYKSMPQYRIDFFNQLRLELEKEKIKLTVVYGQSSHLNRSDEKKLEWGIYRENKIFNFSQISIYWQPIFDLIQKNDLVIVEQANSLLINYYLILLRVISQKKLGFWGHGRNRQGNEKSIFNFFKKSLIKNCDHWFAYTSSVKQYILDLGFSEKKISLVNNSFDTVKLCNQYLSITEQKKNRIRNILGIDPSDDVAIYCGALYKEKRLRFLLSAIDQIHDKNSKFKFLIIGAGNDINNIINFSQKRDWVYYLGPKFDLEKALFFSISKLFLMPGAVGLAALDSFALQTPLILCDINTHGPEVDYLTDGVNCIFCKDDITDFTTKTISILENDSMLKSLTESCLNSAKEITLDKMVKEFSKGIKICLYD